MPLVSPLPLPQANGRARSVPLHPLAYLDVHSSAAVPAPCNTRAVANLVLGSFALLGVLTALFWKLISPSGFPFLLVPLSADHRTQFPIRTARFATSSGACLANRGSHYPQRVLHESERGGVRVVPYGPTSIALALRPRKDLGRCVQQSFRFQSKSLEFRTVADS